MKTLNEALTEYDIHAKAVIDSAIDAGMGKAMILSLRRRSDQIRELTISGHRQTHRQAIAENPNLIDWHTVKMVCFGNYAVCDFAGETSLIGAWNRIEATTPRQALIVLGVLQRETLAA